MFTKIARIKYKAVLEGVRRTPPPPHRFFPTALTAGTQSPRSSLVFGGK